MLYVLQLIYRITYFLRNIGLAILPWTCYSAPFTDGRETPSLCCQNGKVRLWPLPASPDSLLLDFVRGNTAQSRAFLANIWRINFRFLLHLHRFQSWRSAPPRCGRTGPADIRYTGGILSLPFSSPMPQAGHHPRYADIYYISAEEEQLRYRLNNFFFSRSLALRFLQGPWPPRRVSSRG